MTVYTLNLRVFWLLVSCVLIALLLIHQALRRGPDPGPEGCPDRALGVLSLLKFALAFSLCYFFIRYCSSYQGQRRRGCREPPDVTPRAGPSRRELLESYYERQVRLSPHVLGHSKAHVAKLVSELVRAGRAELPPESALAFRGDFIQIGSAYEEHKVGRPDCFDILVPLRLPRGLKLEPRSCPGKEGGPPLCSLETPRRSEWLRRHRVFAESLLSPAAGGDACQLGPAPVLRWFYPTVQRCLGAVRYPFEQRCSLGLSLSEDRVLLRLTPRSDYVCCHISMGVRLIPALPLGEGAYLVAAAAAARGSRQEALWTPYFPRQEQRLLGWLKARVPAGSCHLKCLQILKAVRDLSGQALDSQGTAQWRAVLSSYALKTAWLHLLLASPPEAWEERRLLDRMEELLRGLRESLHRGHLGHLFLGGDPGLLPDSLALPKPFKDAPASNLLAGFDPAVLELVAARLAYSWTHLHRLIRLGRPQRDVPGRGMHCKHLEAE
ncbi:inositol 1,4,5-trisphosphate receptor-interacting protein-like 2 [Lepisosteus oculatus]|uniref:inositol 1,4,5-trisphosphate receptor-interacting protein-like 2 n=1 Tax=Lepisosteus oculatus TaxID=7918 RepID=UPI0035F5224B